MNEETVAKVLKIVVSNLKNKKITWRLGGSANLLVQRLELPVRDVDISTDDKGLEEFRYALKKYVIKDFYSEKIKGLSLICNINNYEVEINSYEDKDKNYFDKIKLISWHGINLPIIPLQYAKEFYKKIGREEKVKLIEDYLNNQQK